MIQYKHISFSARSLVKLTAVSTAILLCAAYPSAAQNKAFPSVIFFDVDKQLETEMVSGAVAAKKVQEKLTKTSPASAISIHVVDQPLDDFLKLAGKQFGVEIQTTYRTKSQIRNMKLAGDMSVMLDQLANQFDFVWYRQDEVVRIAPKDKSIAKMVYLGKMRYPDFISNLSQAGLNEANLQTKHIPSSNSVLVNGPASLIARVELVAEGYNKNASGVSVIGFGKKR